MQEMAHSSLALVMERARNKEVSQVVFFPWDEYQYTRFILTNGTEVVITSLLVRDIDWPFEFDQMLSVFSCGLRLQITRECSGSFSKIPSLASSSRGPTGVFSRLPIVPSSS